MKDGVIVSEGTPQEMITEDMLREVFEIESTVTHDPQTGVPIVLPERALSSRRREAPVLDAAEPELVSAAD
jgi:iron complex transport system ATP-binding protein